MFKRDPTCTACPLYKGAQTVCVPTVRHQKAGSTALVFIGQNPGAEEDRAGVPFVGPSGKLLRSMYIAPFRAVGLFPSIFLTNAVRCFGAKVPRSAATTCPPLYLEHDLDQIERSFDQVGLVCTGALAVQVVTRAKLESQFSLATALKNQGLRLPSPHTNLVLYATYHPAYILRFPAQGRAVVDHLQLVRRWLTGDTPQRSKPHRVPASPPPDSLS